MTNQEILTKAIEKAIAGGWDAEMLGGVDDWPEFSELERQHVVNMMVNYETKTGYMMLIYLHDFAKALWGEQPYDTSDSAAGQSINWNRQPAWQYHLQRMVIAENPLDYLKENI